MHLSRLLSRRPSPAIAISSVALFLSLGGVGYAAIQVPHNSVGAYQLRDNSVNYKKIVPGSVGLVRANLSQLQERVSGTCPSNSAIATIDQAGKVSCNATLPGEYGTTSNSANLTTAPSTVNSINLPGGPSYLAFANPDATVTAPATGGTTSGPTTVSCTLTVGSNTQTRSVTVPAPAAGESRSAAIPLQVAGAAGASSLSCTSTGPATVVSAINALATSSNS